MDKILDLKYINENAESIRNFAYSNYIKISLLNKQFKIIQPGIFINFKNLLEIDLRNNNITNIQSGTFVDLPYVEKIQLNSNKITNISPGSFSNLPKLQVIGIMYNKLIRILPQTFLNLPNLERIYLGYNQLNNIESGIFINLPKLETISLLNNQIINISPKSFENLPKLTQIFLSSNQITFLYPETFDNLPRLNSLFIDFSFLTNSTLNLITHVPALVEAYERRFNQITYKSNVFITIVKDSPLYKNYLLNNPTFNIVSVHDIIGDINNFKIMHKIFPDKSSFYDIFINTEIQHKQSLILEYQDLPNATDSVLIMAMRIQLLLNYFFNENLKLSIDEEQLFFEKIRYLSIDELKEHTINFPLAKLINNSKNKNIVNRLPNELNEYVKTYLGGELDTDYKSKYLKYKKKYLQIKNS